MRIVFFVLISLFRAGIIFVVILPHINETLGAISIGLFAIEALGFLLASCKDPGYTTNLNDYSLIDYFEIYRGDYICSYCNKRKSKNARHCHYCKRCVKVTET